MTEPGKEFEGWYYKHQANGNSLAIIPGRASDGAFVLVITNDGSYHIPYPLTDYQKGDILRVGSNSFTSDGISLNINHPNLTLTGEISYTDLTLIRGDIMGPFRFFPMECRHGIVSMKHNLCGAVTLNGEMQNFNGGKGYIESDSGRSFPEKYTWVQCNDFKQDCSIMASVARIPFYGLRFWGCICVVYLNGQEYRLATYKGVKILQCKPDIIVLKQGKYRLDITITPHNGHQLPAPRLGKMSHSIRESVSCAARFQFFEGKSCLFDEASDCVGYEWEVG